MSKMVVTFFVPGLPKTAGSKRVFLNRRTGKPIVTDDSGQPGKMWRSDVKFAACKEYVGEPLTGALALSLTFYLPRPQSHYGSGKNSDVLKPSAPKYPTGKPDSLKLARSVEDALTSIIWRDDAQIVAQQARKKYCDETQPQPGVLVRVEVWE
jgi:Holliday junction resolvase RusA-like endonuclease